ncbi:MYND-type domain-containing protein [Mycena kentingensis (nom. inval.)]|nr:MYND-type domain-containing protein [Mycena kentingensis (nom. inval.)]
MVPECKPSVLERLPLRARLVAKSVCTPKPSISTITDMRRLLELIDVSTDDLMHLYLPVCYVTLDPARIPRKDVYEPDHGSVETARHIHLAVLLIPAIQKNSLMGKYISDAAAEEMLPRFWAWAKFLQHSHAQLTHIPANERAEPLLYTSSLVAVGHFCDHDAINRDVAELDELFVVCGLGWRLASDRGIGVGRQRRRVYRGMQKLLDTTDGVLSPVEQALALSEIRGSVGGTELDLARVLVQHLKATPRRMQQGSNISFPDGALSILRRLSGPTPVDGDTSSSPLWAALVTSGITTVLVRILRSTVEATEAGLYFPDAHKTLVSLLYNFEWLLTSATGSADLPRALADGLLHSLLRLAGSRMQVNPVPEMLSELFDDIIPTNVYRASVLRAIAADINEIRRLAGLRTHVAPLFDDWERVAPRLDERLALYARYKAERVGVCGNPACLRKCAKADLRRCGTCKVSLYCSKACQRADWKDGDHRGICSTQRAVLFDGYGANLSLHDIEFLRFQMTHDLARTRVRAQALAQQGEATKHKQPVITLFEYATMSDDPVVDIDVYASAALREFRYDAEVYDGPAGPETVRAIGRLAEAYLARARRNVRTQLHIARVPVGGPVRQRHVPVMFVTDPLLCMEVMMIKAVAAPREEWDSPTVVGYCVKLLEERVGGRPEERHY